MSLRWAAWTGVAVIVVAVLSLKTDRTPTSPAPPSEAVLSPVLPSTWASMVPLGPIPGITLPRPLIVAGSSVASSGQGRLAVDGDPLSAWVPRKGEPGWLSFRLQEPVPSRLLVIWQARGYRYDYHRTAPHQYRYQVSADSPDGRTGIWQTTFQAENRVGRRADVFAVPAGRWLRLQIDTSWSAAPSLAEVGVFDATASGPLACWLILGDSITSSSLLRQAAWERTHRDKRTPLPVFINGGTSGDTAANGLTRLAKALPLCPPGTFVGLAYGTNDATQAVPLPQFAGQLQRMIAAIRQRGCLPMLARPPWNPNPRLASYVTAIDRLTRDHGLPPGPDLYGWFRQRPQELGPDHLHPTATGEESVQRLWQLAAMRLVSPPSPPVASAQPATGR